MEPIIHLKDVSMVYGCNGTRTTALSGISFDVRQGEYVVLTGESGAGKSTMLTILGGLQVPTEGAVRIGGADLSALPADGLADFRRKTIGFVFQAYHLLPYLTARENVMVPMSPERVSPREKASSMPMPPTPRNTRLTLTWAALLAWATAAATCCWWKPPAACAPVCANATRWPAWAGTSSPSS